MEPERRKLVWVCGVEGEGGPPRPEEIRPLPAPPPSPRPSADGEGAGQRADMSAAHNCDRHFPYSLCFRLHSSSITFNEEGAVQQADMSAAHYFIYAGMHRLQTTIIRRRGAWGEGGRGAKDSEGRREDCRDFLVKSQANGTA